MVTDPTLIGAIVAGGLAVVGGIIFAAVTLERKRSEALSGAALRLGFSFLDKVPGERLATLGDFPLFQRGHSQKARNLMEGKSGDGPVTLLDYQYTVGGGKNSHISNQSVAIFPVAAALPVFTLGPEHFWQKIGSLLGYQDIDFETSEEFSRHYLLRGPDENAIRAAFGAHVLGFFAQQLGWSVESNGSSLAVYRSEKRCDPGELPAFVAEAGAVKRTLAPA